MIQRAIWAAATMAAFAYALPHTEAGSWWRLFAVAWASLSGWQMIKARWQLSALCGIVAASCVVVPMLFGDRPSPLVEWQGVHAPEMWAMLIWLGAGRAWLLSGRERGAACLGIVGILYGAHWWVPVESVLIGVELVLTLFLLATWGSPDGRGIVFGRRWRMGVVFRRPLGPGDLVPSEKVEKR